MWFDGPARAAADDMWGTSATHSTTSTVPTRPLTCFDGPARAVAHDMRYTTATTASFLGTAGSLSAKYSYVCLMYFWQIASGV